MQVNGEQNQSLKEIASHIINNVTNPHSVDLNHGILKIIFKDHLLFGTITRGTHSIYVVNLEHWRKLYIRTHFRKKNPTKRCYVCKHTGHLGRKCKNQATINTSEENKVKKKSW